MQEKHRRNRDGEAFRLRMPKPMAHRALLLSGLALASSMAAGMTLGQERPEPNRAVAIQAAGLTTGQATTGQSTTGQSTASQSSGQATDPATNQTATRLAEPQPAAAARTGQSQIKMWIDQLGDTSFIKRQIAKEELQRIGLPAFELLRAAENHPNVEIAHSAVYLLHSMHVDWTSSTDSFEVHRLLKDYGEYRQSAKLDCLQRIARLKRVDGYVALMRLLRYDNDEIVSKQAALYLMDAAIDNDARPLESQRVGDWAEFFRGGVGESGRTSASWLLAMADSLEKPQGDLAQFQKLVLTERKLLESNAKTTTNEPKTDEQIVKRLYRAVAKTLLNHNRRTEAIAFFEPCLELVGTSSTGFESDIQWMLEAGLAEAVLALEAQQPNLFATRAKYRYWLAESYLKSGQAAKAEEIAAEARDLLKIKRDGANARVLAGRYDPEAMQRLSTAEQLSKRGLFNWAEAEMLTVERMQSEKGLIPAEQEVLVRDQLAQFYWTADEPARAAAAWRPLMLRAGLLPDENKEGQVDPELVNTLKELRTNDLKSYSLYIPGRYHFFLGLAETKNNQPELARKHLLKAIATDGEDPDFMIALHKVAGDDAETKTALQDAIRKLEIKYRGDIVKFENELSVAPTRAVRAESEENIATACNQLAWLLAGTERKASEAISLSERSLLLTPDEPVYMDTLARCYFSAGNVDKAIDYQSRAVSMRPFERSMQRQLAEFVAAKK